MKLKYIFLLLFFSSLLFLNMDCTEKPDPVPEPQLPPLTHEGKNTFGCLVNGELWLPDVDGGMGVVHELSCEYVNGYFDLDAKIFTKDKNQKISLTLYNSILHKDKIYMLNDKNPGSGYYLNYRIPCTVRTDSLINGKLIISFIDTLTRIVSGTFNFTAYSIDCDTIRITDGRFDVKYIY